MKFARLTQSRIRAIDLNLHLNHAQFTIIPHPHGRCKTYVAQGFFALKFYDNYS